MSCPLCRSVIVTFLIHVVSVVVVLHDAHSQELVRALQVLDRDQVELAEKRIHDSLLGSRSST
jgi:hypothetical protein